MSRSNALLTGLTAALILAGTHTSADVLAEYTFTGNSPASTDTTLLPNATDANFGSWDGTWTGTTTGFIGFNFGVAFVSTSLTTDALTTGTGTGAVGRGDYLAFTIQGSGFDITSIAFEHAISDSDADATYQAHLYTSETGLIAGQVSTLTGTGVAVAGGLTYVPTGGALDGLTSDLEVRIYFTDSQDVNGFAHSIDNIIVQGTPEPTSLAVLGILGVLVLSRRRRAA